MTGLTASRTAEIAADATRLIEAADSGVPCAPVRSLIGREDAAAAYAVQEQITARRVQNGATVIGRKIGLTSEVVQKQLGVDQPDFGVLFEDMAHRNGDTVPFAGVLQPRVEAEVAFVLRSGLAQGPLDYEQVQDAIDYAVAALEICSSRVEGCWDISFGDTVADDASAGAFVLSSDRYSLEQVAPKNVAMEMMIDGAVVSAGTGAACLGDTVQSVVWLAQQAREFGEPMRAGPVILSGALGAMRPVTPGAEVVATITGLGSVSVNFSE
jgi:2-keto-4-pentenoate hydratase